MSEKIKVLLSEEEVDARIQQVAAKISKDYAGKEVHLICVLKGGVFFTCELAKRITVPVTLDFMSVSSYGDDTKSSGVVKIVKDLDVVTPSVHTPVSRLSGGNVQKVLVGREIAENPEVLVVSYPVRGLDINSSYAIYNLLNEQKRHGVAVICVIEDLDVLLELCDRILILHAGEVSGIVDARAVTKDELGLYMAGSRKDTEYYE